MKKQTGTSSIESIIRSSGFVVAKEASINHPIPIKLSYSTNSDGSVRWFWPVGTKCKNLSKVYSSKSVKGGWFATVEKIFFALGLGSFVANGRLVLYADLPTATYIVKQWRREA